MELIPLMTLWLCMPLDDKPVPIQIHDRNIFPALKVVEEERDKIWEVHVVACEMCRRTNYKSKYWMLIGKESARRFNIWNSIYYAHKTDGDYVTKKLLEDLRDKLGYENYYTGQMPSPIYLESKLLNCVPAGKR
jgi:hypothetical protein